MDLVGEPRVGWCGALFGGGGVTDRDQDVDDVPASEACWPPDPDSPSLLNRGSFDCFCCPHTSVPRPSMTCLTVFPCA